MTQSAAKEIEALRDRLQHQNVELTELSKLAESCRTHQESGAIRTPLDASFGDWQKPLGLVIER
ncbi:MAG: hypothetical protein AAGE01_25300 [Pseudomonadota bacterium]